MATIVTRSSGQREIRCPRPGGGQATIRLGAVPKRQAEAFRLRVESLLSAAVLGQSPDHATCEWVAGLPAKMRERLGKAGLIDFRPASTLKDLLDAFKDGLAVKDSTRRNLAVVEANLLTFFDPDLPISDITAGDAREFRAWLSRCGGKHGRRLARTTVSRRTRRCKQIFAVAVKKKWLAESPFSEERGWSEVNRSRDYFVDPQIITDVLEEIPDLEFRGVVVLARFGGLRCPSEVLPLTWRDVDWRHETLRVASPKTERYEGGVRLVPLFPEVRKALGELWDQAEPGATLIFPRLQVTGAALTGRLDAACRNASVVLWPKPWQNLRATRETELLGRFPIHVVAQWIGHSPTVAVKYYAQVVKQHHDDAVKMDTKCVEMDAKPVRFSEP